MFEGFKWQDSGREQTKGVKSRLFSEWAWFYCKENYNAE